MAKRPTRLKLERAFSKAGGLLETARRLFARPTVTVRLGCAVTVFSFLLLILGALEPMERTLLDARYVSRALWFNEEPSPHILVVAIDDRSLAELGRWPWDRRIHALMIDTLHELGAGVVAFDVLFEDPSAPQIDRRLAEAIARAGNVVLPARAEAVAQRQARQRHERLTVGRVAGPLENLAVAAAAVGHVNVLVDADGVVRRLPLRLGRRPVEALSLSALRVWMAQEGEESSRSRLPGMSAASASGGGLDEPGLGLAYRLGLESSVTAGVRLARTGLAKSVSYVDVLNGRVGPDQVKGRIVFIGLAAPVGGADQYLTPYPIGPVPGVFIHAAAAATLLHGPAVQRLPIGYALLLVAGAAIGGAFVFTRLSPGYGLLALCTGTVVFSVLSVGMFVTRGWWVEMAAPFVAGGLAYGGTIIEGYRREAQQRREARAVLARYLPPEVAREALRRASELELGGARRRVTIIFADLRGFTGFAEDENPQVVVDILNRYLHVMADGVFRWGGTLCKYTGDGIMALFGAPVPQVDHAWRALGAAEDIRARCRALAGELSGRPGMRRKLDLAVGIGLASGDAVVGNIGSPERMEYSAVGDAVNVAARLENRAEPWEIVAAESTLEEIETRDFGEVWLSDLLAAGRGETLRLAGRKSPLAVRRL